MVLLATLVMSAIVFIAKRERPDAIGPVWPTLTACLTFPVWITVCGGVVAFASFGIPGLDAPASRGSVLFKLLLPPSLMMAALFGITFRSWWVALSPIAGAGVAALFDAVFPPMPGRPGEGEGAVVIVAMCWLGVVVPAIAAWIVYAPKRVVPPGPPPTKCGRCGYSFVGLPTGAPCPECGAGRG